MKPADGVKAGLLVDSASHALRDGSYGLKEFPERLEKILRTSAWKRRVIPQNDEEVEFASFAVFVETPILKGLGSTVEQVQKLCVGRGVVEALLDAALQGKHGGDKSNVNNVNVARPQGNARQRVIRRLRQEGKGGLLDQVLSGELSANAAAIEAGFRRPMRSVPIDSPASAINALLRVFTRRQLEAALRKAGT